MVMATNLWFESMIKHPSQYYSSECSVRYLLIAGDSARGEEPAEMDYARDGLSLSIISHYL